MMNPPIVGHNTHQYKVVSGWGNLDANLFPVKDCHEMVIDASGHIFLFR